MKINPHKALFLVAFGVTTFHFSAFGQVADADFTPSKFRFLSFGLVNSDSKDQLGSPLLWIGKGLSIEFGRSKTGEKWQKELRLTSQNALTKNRIDGSSAEKSGLQFFGKLAFSTLRKTDWLGKKWSLAVGGRASAEVLFNIFPALGNNAVLHRWHLGMGPAASISRPFFMRKKALVFSADLGLPLLGYSARPTFLGIETNELSGISSFFTDGARFSSLHNNVGFDYQLALDRPFSNGNRYRLAWRGLLFSDKTNATGGVSFASSMLSFGYFFNVPMRNDVSK